MEESCGRGISFSCIIVGTKEVFMDIKKINENQVRCAITEEEIAEMGFDINAVIANTEETQKFMRVLLEKIEEQEVIDIDRLSPMVRAELFPDHTMNIIFGSGGDINPKQMFDELVDMFEGWDKLKKLSSKDKKEADQKIAKEKEASEAVDNVLGKEVNPFHKEGDETETGFSDYTVLALECDTLDKVIYLSRLFAEVPMNELYKMEENYYLLMDLSFLSKEKFRPVAFAATEYGCRPIATEKALAHIREHGKCIIKEDAIGKLKQV